MSLSDIGSCPAADAGMRVGDLITAFNNIKVTNVKDLMTLIQKEEGKRSAVSMYCVSVTANIIDRTNSYCIINFYSFFQLRFNVN